MTGTDETLAGELAACPFCGGGAVVIEEGRQSRTYTARCDSPKCRVLPEITSRFRDRAIEIWNTRKGAA